VKTSLARKVLPSRIRRAAAVASCANACAITAAFASRRYQKLRATFDDQLHQPFREKLVPILRSVSAAAEGAGALGAFLSGSGSSICAVTLRDHDRVAAAMLRAAKSRFARTVTATADNRGVMQSLTPNL
jgi:homoserine kinase